MLQRHQVLDDLPPNVGPHAPQAWGDFAYQRFCTPSLSRHRSPDHGRLVARARFHLRHAEELRIQTSTGDLQAYVFEPDGPAAASVLLVHGWTGEAAFMSAFAEQFRRRGLRAVLFDLPAHGRSSGAHTTLISCGHAVREVAEALGPIQYAVGHSLGGHAVLLAGTAGAPMPRAYPFQDFVLVAVPNRFSQVTDSFSEELGLTGRAPRLRAPPGAHCASPDRGLHGREAARRDRPTRPPAAFPRRRRRCLPRRRGDGVRLQDHPAAGLRPSRPPQDPLRAPRHPRRHHLPPAPARIVPSPHAPSAWGEG